MPTVQNNKQHPVISALVIILFMIFIAALSSLFWGCQSAPNRKHYNSDECYMQADCMYRNAKNPDKSVCKDNAAECTAAQKEKRAYERIEYCKDPSKRPEGMSENECRLWLNQK